MSGTNGTRVDTSGIEACHELLLRLAGRMPDDLLWRMRDWLAAGGNEVLAVTLPRELLRHRIGLTEEERELLIASVGAWGATRRSLDAVLPTAALTVPTATFRPGPGGPGAAELSALAVVRGHAGCVELRTGVRSDTHSEQRALVVLGGERPWLLAGTLQRIMRAHGDRTPCVEVLPAHGDAGPYHREAIIGTSALWRSTDALVV